MRTFSIGNQVEHKLFGKGIILDIESAEDSSKLTIEFSGKISKKIISTFIKLVKK